VEKVEKGDIRMENQMSRKLGIWVILMSLIAVALLSGLWAWLSFSSFGIRVFPFSPGAPEFDLTGLEFLYIARTVLSTVNIAILSILTASYAMLYSKTRSQFTIGLLIFSAVFLMKDIASSPFVIGAARYTLSGLGPFALIEPLLEFMALAVLLYFNLEY
jgi:hypothetical protein